MPLPVNFGTLPAGNQNLSLLDQQFAALGALSHIPCNATGGNNVMLTPQVNTPTIAAYTNLAPVFMWVQPTTTTGTSTLAVGALASLQMYRSNGQVATGAGDLVGGAAYRAFYLNSLNGGLGGFVVDPLVILSGGGTAGVVVGVNVYLASQTIVIPAQATKAYCYMWGATGGSGGVSNAISTGTGAGGYLEKYLTGLTPTATLTFVCGASGAAGPTNGPGGSATNTTLSSGTQGIGTLTCTPSPPSPAGYGNNYVAVGGVASGGDINVTGQQGGLVSISSNVQGSAGGRNFYSCGANGATYGPGAGPGLPGNPGGLIVHWLT